MNTARVTEKIITNSLRRGFIPINDDGDVVSPVEFKNICIEKIKSIESQIEDLHLKLGKPNKKNLKHKYKGIEHKLGRNQYIAKRYFDLGDEIQDIRMEISLVNDWLNKNNPTYNHSDFELLQKAVFDTVGKVEGGKIMDKYSNLKADRGYEKEDWLCFLNEIIGDR